MLDILKTDFLDLFHSFSSDLVKKSVESYLKDVGLDLNKEQVEDFLTNSNEGKLSTAM